MADQKDIFGASFAFPGNITINGPMFDIHDNEKVENHYHFGKNEDSGKKEGCDKKDGCDSGLEADFDKDAVLEYVGKIKDSNEETNEKMKTFWSSLVERWADLATIRYNKSESCFKRGRSEDRNVNFSKKFVCCVIGYLINTDKYHLTNTKICEMLGENSDNGSARLKNMQDCLKDYDNKVEKVVKEVIKEVFG